MEYDAIRKKRDGVELTSDEIRALFGAYMAGDVTEYQMSAFLMSVFFRGMTPAELAAFVAVMLRSGAVADLSSVPGIKVDKHSTGGVGDKVSLVLAPLVSSLGVPVPMMSGRGLGHTGGTVDKLESIPGFRTDLSIREYTAQMQRIGCALIAQTAEVAPLDRRLYALRDVTATIESIPLIASSIMSKKLAEGIDALVLDIKHGPGAFLPEFERAEALANTMIAIGLEHGREVVALVTAMDRPLGHAIGNALEVEEAIFSLRGEGPDDLRELTLALAAEMLVLGRAAEDRTRARALAEAALRDGRALEKLREVITAQGGNECVVDDPAVLPQAPVRRILEAAARGVIESIDVRAIGRAAVALGAGRKKIDDIVYPGVGFHITVKPGDRVDHGAAMATVFAMDEQSAEAGVAALRHAIRIASAALPMLPLVSHRITARGTELLASS
jgi:pyrimidine-nucleoside phosphorylase